MLLAFHNLVRWVVLITAVVALVRALRGVGGADAYATGARRSVAHFVTSLHVQLLLGLVVFGTSTLTRTAMQDMGTAMKDPATRFYIAEHPTFMILAVIVATLTGIIARRGPDDAVRHRRAGIGVALALGLIIAGMPWERPLFPGF